MRAVLALALVLGAALASGCAGRSCDGLAAEQAERDAARQAYASLVRGGGSPAETERADAELHGLERRVLAYEQGCAG